MRASCLIWAILGVVFLISPAALATTYQITDLGAFDFASVSDFNNCGQIVGQVNQNTAFVWSAEAGFTYLPALHGYLYSSASAINDKGQVVGRSDGPSSRACLWEPGKPVQDLGALPCGPNYTPSSRAMDINESGAILGSSTSSTGRLHGIVWDSAGQRELIAPGDSTSISPQAMNDDGVVIGAAFGRPFIWNETGYHDMGQLGQYPYFAVDINNSGMVILQDASPYWVPADALVWDEVNGARSIGSLSADGYSSFPCDINNSGRVVGFSGVQPFVWDEVNGIQPLPTPPGYGVFRPTAINDLGQIAGTSGFSGKEHLLLWTPVPEPSSLLAMLGGVSCVVGLWKRSRIA